jgi:hypothetical protein
MRVSAIEMAREAAARAIGSGDGGIARRYLYFGARRCFSPRIRHGAVYSKQQERKMGMKKVSTMTVGSLFVLTAIAFTGPASAQGTAAQRTACMGDAFRFCSADIPNVSRIETCLLQNRDRLSPACQAQFDNAGNSQLTSGHVR